MLRKEYLRNSFNLNIASYIKKFNEDGAWVKIFKKNSISPVIKSLTLKILAEFLEEAPENTLAASVDAHQNSGLFGLIWKDCFEGPG